MVINLHVFVAGTPEVADQVNQDFDILYTYLNKALIQGSGSPYGILTASIGSIYADIAPSNHGNLYVNTIDNSNIGWELIPLTGSVSSETTRAEAAELVLTNAITAETSRAEGVETILQNSLSSSNINTSNALSTLTNNLSAGVK